jgi:hypothetical protein
MGVKLESSPFAYLTNVYMTEANQGDKTHIRLIMGDGRTIEPLGVLRDSNVSISYKNIPTDLFIIDV